MIHRGLRIISGGFLLWIALAATAAALYPPAFIWFAPWIAPGLGLIMLGMGMTLTAADFRRVATMPRAVACGLIGQFTIMPLLALGLAKAFRLPPELALGFVILGCCPGGTASNVIAYLAKADVALSVTMTACSTLMAIVLTPWLTHFLGGQYLPVDAWGLFETVLKIILLPIAAGFLLRRFLGKRLEPFIDVFPAISVLFIVLIVAAIIGKAQHGGTLASAAGITLVVAILHNTGGLALGYGLATLFRLPKDARRTIAIEVGMQNSGLGVTLATAHFPGTLAALPSALFSVLHNLTGSALAAWWGRRK